MKRCFALAVAAAVTGGVALAATSTLVFAHSRPIRFDPAPGAVLSAAPAQVTGWFNADLRRDPNWTFLKVTDAQGARVDAGETQLSANRRQMTVSLRSGLGPGRYIVTWRTFDDADGAIFGDCYVFFVGQAAADQAIADNFRLDAGRTCERIDVSARDGTPVAGGTPQATAVAGDEGHDDEGTHAEGGSDGTDVPLWALIAGVAGGLVVGLMGGRLVGKS